MFSLFYIYRYRIGPFEVESALIEHPAVLESAVVSSPDQTRGEVTLSYVHPPSKTVSVCHGVIPLKGMNPVWI